MDETTRKTIGAFFKEQRIQAGYELSIVDQYLEATAGQALAMRYESGHEEIPAHHLFALANLYNVPPDELVNLFYDLVRSSQRIASIPNNA